jgi:hypothetical protein
VEVYDISEVLAASIIRANRKVAAKFDANRTRNKPEVSLVANSLPAALHTLYLPISGTDNLSLHIKIQSSTDIIYIIFL